LVTTGLVLALVVAGCQERNPAFVQKVVRNDASVSSDRPADAVEVGTSHPDTPQVHADGPGKDAAVPGPDFASDVANPAGEAGVSNEAGVASEAGVTVDVASPDTRDTSSDTRDVRKTENDAGVDASRDVPILVDTDRDVPLLIDVGVTDVGLDIAPPLDADVIEAAVDMAPLCHELDTLSCSLPGNPLLGACHAGLRTCTGGTWGDCVGEVLPAAVELCNGIDDNCNGMTDEGCAADCVVVAPSGSDDGNGTAAKPLATIAVALVLANAQDGGAPRRVCVAGGATCDDTYAYVLDAPLVMANGGRVQGNYALADSVLSYCPDSQPPTTTLQFAAVEQGVVFDQSVTSPTELSGFAIGRYSPSSGGAAAGPVSAVLVSGGVGVTLSGIFVTDAPVADTTYGVDVENGGQATIVGSAIAGGQGRKSAVGVYVDGGSVNLRNNCDGNPQGFCNSSCGAGGSVLGIRGRTGASVTSAAADSSAVYVTKASPSTTSIVANALCGGSGTPADGARGANLATLRCESGACAKIAGNTIGGGSGRQTVALSLLEGASLVDGNLIVAGCGSQIATGVVLDNAPARLQNNRIVGGSCQGVTTPDFYGVHIILGSSSGEPDLHSNDIDPMGTSNDCRSYGVAVERGAGDNASAGILRNNIISAGNCRTRIAVDELSDSTARVVENNDLYPGPATSATDTPVLYHRGGADVLGGPDAATALNSMAGAAKNISADPKFVAAPNNLHLSSSSLCIDHGTAEGAPATDGDGNPRPAGAGFDIGAYEFVAP
jgi:hypothetical protein